MTTSTPSIIIIISYFPCRFGCRALRPPNLGGLGICGVLYTNIYIDGFNLYYGAVKNTPYKWLNVATACRTLFPTMVINRIKYFTARVKRTLHDPSAPTRQGIYFRALQTIPNLTVIEGHFVKWPKLMHQYPLAYYQGTSKPPQRVQVEKAEEKGSDVNLACHLLLDAFNNDFNEAIVVSNDSDLVLPIKMARNHFGKVIRLINPSGNNVPFELRNVATSLILGINRSVLASSQFATTLSDSRGTFTKPPTW